MSTLKTSSVIAQCCRVCEDERIAKLPVERRMFEQRFVICRYCGNKRCPKASWHKQACTDSNEPGQPGSFYGHEADWPRQGEGTP